MAKKQLLRAFVLMPFREELDWAYEKLVKPAFEAAAYEVIRADDIDSQQSILKDIVTAIVASDVIIADLTGANPNVYYELGLSHALKKQVVLLSQDVSAAPFDLRSYRIIEYGARFDKFESTQKRLTTLAHDISKGRVSFGNPVSDFVQRDDGGPEKTGTDPDETVKAGVEDEDEPGVLDLVYETEEGLKEQKELLEETTKQITLLGGYATETTQR